MMHSYLNVFLPSKDIKDACKRAIELILRISGSQILSVLESSGGFCKTQVAQTSQLEFLT